MCELCGHSSSQSDTAVVFVYPDEQQIWNQIQAIKAMPIPMARKRERKDKLLVSYL